MESFLAVTHTSSTDIFKMQKRIIRLITNTGRQARFMSSTVQTTANTALSSQYVFSLLVFVNKNRELFLSNSAVHDVNTLFKHDLQFTINKFNTGTKRSPALWKQNV